MSYFHFAPEQVIGLPEYRKIQSFLDAEGFRKNIKENSVFFGLIKSNSDTTFTNGRVTRDVDSGGNKTIKIAPLSAVDKDGLFITSPSTINQIVVPDDGNWHWVKARHTYTTQEQGIVTISANGDLIGTGTEFTKLFRGLPHLPSRIKFLNAVHNTQEYIIGGVDSDTSAWLSNPGATFGSAITFEPESDLKFAVISSFTPGIPVDEEDKYPYHYDGMAFDLVEETILNTRPDYTIGKEFYLARIKVSGVDVIVQDKRTEYYETKGSELAINIDRNANPLVGLESIVWPPKTNPANKSQVYVAWGMRSTNWTIDANQNIVTIVSGLGGKFKTVSDFTDGDFDGWRVYTGNGKYSYVVSSVQSAGAIRLTLDHLDVDNYSSDGGTTLISQEVHVVPNCETVEFYATSDPTDNAPSVNRHFAFPVNDAVGILDLEVFKSESVFYNIKYRYKSFKEFTEFTPIPTDEDNGYFVETNFSDLGVQSGTTRQVYESNETDGFIELQPCPWSYNHFQSLVYVGDLLSVYTIPNLAASSTINLTVGTDPYYQIIKDTHTIATDTSFILGSGVKGNKFVLHFQAEQINLAGNQIQIKQTDGVTVLKSLSFPDFYQMKNQDGGIVITCIHDGTAWTCSQNYSLGVTHEIKMFDPPLGTPLSSLFDTTISINNAKGKVKSLWGWALCNHSGTVDGVSIPNLSAAFIVGHGTSPIDGTVTLSPGATGGELKHTLTEAELPTITPTFAAAPHTHTFTGIAHGHRLFFRGREGQSGTDYQTIQVDGGNNVNLPNEDGSGSGAIPPVVYTAYNEDVVAGGTNANSTVTGTVRSFGSDEAHNNMPPYYTAVYIKRLY